MRTLVFDAHPYEIPFLSGASNGRHYFSYVEEKLSSETISFVDDYNAIAVFTADDLSASIIEKLHARGVRYIALRCTGYDHVDLQRCQSLGLSVANVPAYSPYSVAEHAVTLLMALNRKLLISQRQIAHGDFRLDDLVGFDIHGKTVGIIGTGAIGMAFAKIMNGFGVTLLGYDPVQYEEARALGIRYVSLKELLQTSDIISIHCPLNEHTHYLIGKSEFEMMKSSAILINTARGGIIKTQDLLQALETNRIKGVCLDVYENEKRIFFQNHPGNDCGDEYLERLIKNTKVVLTGHQGFLTNEALTGIAATTVRSLSAWEEGRHPETELKLNA